MTSATAAIEIAAPIARVWDTLVDADAFSDWHPCFTIHHDIGHDLRSGDRLTAMLPLGDGAGLAPVDVLVLELRRHRAMTLLLLPPSTSRSDAVNPAEQIDLHDVGLYRVDVRAIGPHGTAVVQHLRLGPDLCVAPADSGRFARLLNAVQETLGQRVELASDRAADSHQIDGTIRVSSRLGQSRHGERARRGLPISIAGWVSRRPRGDAA